LSIRNAKREASSGTPVRAEQTAFTGASWPRTSRTQSRPGTPDGSHGGRWVAEMALRAFVEDWREQSDKQNGDD